MVTISYLINLLGLECIIASIACITLLIFIGLVTILPLEDRASDISFFGGIASILIIITMLILPNGTIENIILIL